MKKRPRHERKPHLEQPFIAKDVGTGLPVIRCDKIASREEEITPDRVADILETQETQWHRAERNSNLWLALAKRGSAMKKHREKPSKDKMRRGNRTADDLLEEYRVNRKRMSISTLTAPADDVLYWRSRSPAERLAYLEYLRLINYGKAACTRPD